MRGGGGSHFTQSSQPNLPLSPRASYSKQHALWEATPLESGSVPQYNLGFHHPPPASYPRMSSSGLCETLVTVQSEGQGFIPHRSKHLANGRRRLAETLPIQDRWTSLTSSFLYDLVEYGPHGSTGVTTYKATASSCSPPSFSVPFSLSPSFFSL